MSLLLLLFSQAVAVADRAMIVPLAPAPVEVSAIDVDARAAGELMFSGTLRIAGDVGAYFSQSRNEAAAMLCPPASGRTRGQVQSGFNINLYPQRTNVGERIAVNISWQRPAGSGCDEGTRTVQVNQTVELPVGGSVLIEGDAGLMVRLRRR